MVNENVWYIICIVFAVVVPYLICSINPAIIAAKVKHGKDIREMGSGNPGLTNTLRTMGKGAALAVLLFDVLKGVISILLVIRFCFYVVDPALYIESIDGVVFYFADIESKKLLFVWLAALTSVLGHCYPIYYKFKGGKAVLVTVATLFVIDWISALILLSLFIIIVLVTKYVSLGSVIAAIAYPICVGLISSVGLFSSYVYNIGGHYRITWHYLYHPYYIMVFPVAIAALLVFKHRGNIKRLFNGTEKKLGSKS